jgi:hypothetical protein
MIIIGADDATIPFAIYFLSPLLQRNPVLGEVVSYLLVAGVGHNPTLRSACDIGWFEIRVRLPKLSGRGSDGDHQKDSGNLTLGTGAPKPF